ncbi:MAG: pantoate--beta-alanine ligase [Firmicutes bacterium HGW-Firmicutes-8]|nr:MAG: pantoate--beta-alanine ligase [Firmicutes bacterium HGW-Firmicutes-8]
MQVIQSIDEIKAFVRSVRGQNKTIGFVPTMGYLHEGHQTLMRKAKKQTDFVVVSIFVNPLQFGVGEDYQEYPRDLRRDSSLAEAAGADVIFAPQVREMYPQGYSTFVDVEKLTDKLCGRSRPGHFKGVTTVVTKLFNIVQPDIAFFGQKDAQQAAVLQKMAIDLNMNLTIQIRPTVREKDGLAMSSRNSYLNPEERAAALCLYRSLEAAKNLVDAGERNTGALKQKIEGLIGQEPLARIDYVEVLSFPELAETEYLKGSSLAAAAVFIGRTRLIDNIIVEV